MRSIFVILMLGLSLSFAACSEKKTDSDKIIDEFEKAGDKIGTSVNKGVRAVKDSTCDMYKSDAECAAQKAKHKVQNKIDEIEDKMQ